MAKAAPWKTMADKVVINYRQPAAQGGRSAEKKRTKYLHDSRIADTLVEYKNSLDGNRAER